MNDTNTSIFSKAIVNKYRILIINYHLTNYQLSLGAPAAGLCPSEGIHPGGHCNLFLRAARQKKDFRSYPLRFGQGSIRFYDACFEESFYLLQPVN